MSVVIRGFRHRTGSRDKEVIGMKARLNRTVLTVAMVAVLLEGLGAQWKW
jgi:hypothetical protein